MPMMFSGYRVTSRYGWRSGVKGKGREFHAGIDLVKLNHSPITAFMGGKVLHAGFGGKGTGLGGYGIVVVLKDPHGRAHVYGHLSSVLIKTGMYIPRGHAVGFQGSTGDAVGAHLHYEIRKAASPQYGWRADRPSSTLNPEVVIKSKGGAPQVKKSRKLILPAAASSWRVYPVGARPVKGNEKGYLRPKKFGGLQYNILGNPQQDVFLIRTADFGQVLIYGGPETGAKIM